MSESDPFIPQSTRKMSVETDRRESVRAVVSLPIHPPAGDAQEAEGTLSLDGFFIGPGGVARNLERGVVVKIEVREDFKIEALVKDAPGDRPDFAFLIFEDLEFEETRALARHLDDLAYGTVDE